MDQKTGTATHHSTHFVADTVGARYEEDLPGVPQHHAAAVLDTKSVVAAPRAGRIVVGIDGSPASARALDKAVTLATALNTYLELVTTWKYPAEYAAIPTEEWSPERDAQEIIVEAAGTQFGENPPAWVSSSAREGTAAQQLIDASAGAEMLVVGSRGHSGVVGLLLGSVSSACAEKAHCPVLVVH
jgi:nucleotide-binding universal stress UspA family protein